ncbi:hypothetical protein BDK51DRAFT_32244 [Blyttiomyces helicus]|uniref:Uncharacterized protein n=1 Tax=Blyttiomyces helicus TaxID=388810 RepID=A0A4P9WJ22_9FUNG|nr:hypothetical protein BDK51DRAFT_32244 [Blyttiomyces helicus]|eukprot:RKO91468.1 hypothetical protein BDK51DRAFT_32244 [Blyttiomyces helicus]
MENQTYLYKARLQELRDELQLLRQNDTVVLKTDCEIVLRDIEKLNIKLTEMISALKSEIGIEVNSHKTDGRETRNEMDLGIQEIHHRLIVKISDLKTRIESMKIESTRYVICGGGGGGAIGRKRYGQQKVRKEVREDHVTSALEFLVAM